MSTWFPRMSRKNRPCREVSESATSVHGSSWHSLKHSTVTLVGGGSEVEQLVQGVAIRLDGIDVLVVRVVGVHHHVQLTALGKSNATQVREAPPPHQEPSFRQREGSEQSNRASAPTSASIWTWSDLRRSEVPHKRSPLFSWWEKTTQCSEVSGCRTTESNLLVRDGQTDRQRNESQQGERQWTDRLTRLTLQGQLLLWRGPSPDWGPGPSFLAWTWESQIGQGGANKDTEGSRGRSQGARGSTYLLHRRENRGGGDKKKNKKGQNTEPTSPKPHKMFSTLPTYKPAKRSWQTFCQTGAVFQKLVAILWGLKPRLCGLVSHSSQMIFWLELRPEAETRTDSDVTKHPTVSEIVRL